MKGEVAVGQKFFNFICISDIIKVGPFGNISTAILVALDCSTVIVCVIPEHVCLVPVGGDPCQITLMHIKLANGNGLFGVGMLVEDGNGQSTVENLDDRI